MLRSNKRCVIKFDKIIDTKKKLTATSFIVFEQVML